MPAFVSKETAGFIVYKDRLFLAWLTYCVFNQLLGLSWQSVFQRWRDVSLLGDVKIRALTLGLHFHRSSHFHSGTEVCTSLWQNCHLPHGPRAQNFVGSSVVQLSTVPNTQGMLQKYWLNYSAEAHSEATYLFHPLSYTSVCNPFSKLINNNSLKNITVKIGDVSHFLLQNEHRSWRKMSFFLRCMMKYLEVKCYDDWNLLQTTSIKNKTMRQNWQNVNHYIQVIYLGISRYSLQGSFCFPMHKNYQK